MYGPGGIAATCVTIPGHINNYWNGESMNVLYVISGLVALAMFVYLFIALMKPEKF